MTGPLATSDHRPVDHVFRALSDPTRRHVLERLSRSAASVSELAQPFEMALPSFLQHLRVLEESGLVGRLARCTITVVDTVPAEPAAHAVLADGTEVVLPLAGVIDVAKECARLKSELETLDHQLDALRARLRNEQFLARARPDVVDAERRKEGEWSTRRDRLARKVHGLCGACAKTGRSAPGAHAHRPA